MNGQLREFLEAANIDLNGLLEFREPDVGWVECTLGKDQDYRFGIYTKNDHYWIYPSNVDMLRNIKKYILIGSNYHFVTSDVELVKLRMVDMMNRGKTAELYEIKKKITIE